MNIYATVADKYSIFLGTKIAAQRKTSRQLTLNG
jgi:hypothetical protein